MSEAVTIVSKMVGRYPNGGAQAGRGYIGGLASVLVNYPAVIARKSHDPFYGVPRECKFLPTPADVIAWCERETAALRRPVELADREAEARARLKTLADEQETLAAQRKLRPTLKQIHDKYGSTWGLSVPPPRKREWRGPTDEELRRRYAREPEGIAF
jgi:hypothetical protein